VSYSGCRDYDWSGWTVLNAKNDFNGDDEADFQLRYTSNGEIQRMTINGVKYAGYNIFARNGWDVVRGRSDFNADGKSDGLLRQAASGAVRAVVMEGDQCHG
jgi:hypothetical protein